MLTFTQQYSENPRLAIPFNPWFFWELSPIANRALLPSCYMPLRATLATRAGCPERGGPRKKMRNYWESELRTVRCSKRPMIVLPSKTYGKHFPRDHSLELFGLGVQSEERRRTDRGKKFVVSSATLGRSAPLLKQYHPETVTGSIP